MYTRVEEFLKDWENEAEATLKIFSALSDASLDKTINSDVRKVARLSWHITLTLGEMLGKAGLNIDCPHEDASLPTAVKQLTDAYKKASDSVLQQIKANWKDADLQVKVPMYGESWEKGTVLKVLVMHQAHHRGQLTVLMRFCGLKVPGIYGPAKEEWAQWGMPAME